MSRPEYDTICATPILFAASSSEWPRMLSTKAAQALDWPGETAREVTDSIGIPTIGIGCGPHCSGQVLVVYDLLNLNPDFRPKFVKHYANGYESVTSAARRYVEEVREGVFPTEEHGFHRR